MKKNFFTFLIIAIALLSHSLKAQERIEIPKMFSNIFISI